MRPPFNEEQSATEEIPDLKAALGKAVSLQAPEAGFLLKSSVRVDRC
jgi:hypothetical protein